MQIVTVPCLEDNYAYILVAENSNIAVVVDPSEAGPVMENLTRLNLTLGAIWNTHHHYDHVGGNKGLLDSFPRCGVVGHASDKGRIPGQSTFAEEGDLVTAEGGLKATIVFNPGHTSGAISYYLPEAGVVFTGDTLFAAGCGRLFEGTAAQMETSLTRLGALPKETKVYCGHEYTLSNLRFAQTVEPDNTAIGARVERVKRQRENGETSMGFSIAEELATNPFLRITEKTVTEAVAREEGPVGDEPGAAFGALRRWKDRFK